MTWCEIYTTITFLKNSKTRPWMQTNPNSTWTDIDRKKKRIHKLHNICDVWWPDSFDQTNLERIRTNQRKGILTLLIFDKEISSTPLIWAHLHPLTSFDHCFHCSIIHLNLFNICFNVIHILNHNNVDPFEQMILILQHQFLKSLCFSISINKEKVLRNN